MREQRGSRKGQRIGRAHSDQYAGEELKCHDCHGDAQEESRQSQQHTVARHQLQNLNPTRSRGNAYTELLGALVMA